jgi:adenosylcobinamide amidohydrolase
MRGRYVLAARGRNFLPPWAMLRAMRSAARIEREGATPELRDAAGRVLIVRLGAPHDVLSWAVVNGGRRRASAVVWRQVDDDELQPGVDPAALLRRSIDAAGLDAAVGLLTARDVARFVEVDHGSARCVATVGLGNALAAGDPPGPMRPVGTINLLCRLAAPLTDEALIEACALAAEARTAAVLEAAVPSRVSGRPATGTGTDCIVIASPVGAAREAYVGKHTRLGADLGAAVRSAVARGCQDWLAELRRG